MKSFIHILFSFRLTGFLLLVMAISIAVATFIENDFGSATARAHIYNATWFELLFLLALVNLLGNMIRSKVFKKGKWSILLFHLSFVLIILGAGITRYFGFTGLMHIREGQTTARVLSDETSLNIQVLDEAQARSYSRPVWLSALYNPRRMLTIRQGGPLKIDYLDHMDNARPTLREIPGGKPGVILVSSGPAGRIYHVLYGQESKWVDNQLFHFNHYNEGGINLRYSGDTLVFRAPFEVIRTRMGDQSRERLAAGRDHHMQAMALYQFGPSQLVLSQTSASAEVLAIPIQEGETNGQTALSLMVRSRNGQQAMTVWGNKGAVGLPKQISLDGKEILLSYGATTRMLPFSLRLEEFILERYPGSDSPSSFESRVWLEDQERQVSGSHRIYMNHILNYRGYRFYQSSYDTDEKGTVLSVNRDPLGTRVTYAGYFFLTLGILLSLFNRNSRFLALNRNLASESPRPESAGTKSTEARRKIATMGFLLLIFPFIHHNLAAQYASTQHASIQQPSTQQALTQYASTQQDASIQQPSTQHASTQQHVSTQQQVSTQQDASIQQPSTQHASTHDATTHDVAATRSPASQSAIDEGEDLQDSRNESLPATPQSDKEIPYDHAAAFGRLLVQDQQGRIKPINTLSSEVIRKVSRKQKIEGRNPEQVMLGMLSDPVYWQTVPMIRVSHEGIARDLGIKGKHASFLEFFDPAQQTSYLLANQVREAHRKKPAERSKYDTELIRTDERLNISYLVYTGSLLRILPDNQDPDNTWHSPRTIHGIYRGEDSLFAVNIVQLYLDEVRKGIRTGEWAQADEYLGFIRIFQERMGGELFPSRFRQKAEILYNRIGIFERLARFYVAIGLTLLTIQLVNTLGRRTRLKRMRRIMVIHLLAGFGVHTAGLALRWYISGHAPWSNGYESLLYISWASMLAGVLFSRQNATPIAVTAVLSWMMLHTAHLSWMDPQLTNLVPVLKSYWLTIHVAVIASSYGFLGLAALLGLLNLILISMQTDINREKVYDSITRLSGIAEMAVIAGLGLLTIGTFLGGVWANESWGRYWAWDPKESWALITILVYAFIAHMRFIPGLKGLYALNLAMLLGYASVLMTYFGVNYYLSGMHSYAAGDPLPVPRFVWYALFTILVVGTIAWFRNRQITQPKTSGQTETASGTDT